MKHQIVLVTGGTGYLGSWVTKLLLEKGYTMRLAVRDVSQKRKYAFLQDIADKSSGMLEVWEADLLDEGSFDKAAEGCTAVIHMASPFRLDVKDPYNELIEPAIKGTKNVLQAATKAGTVQRVVLTSSVAAIYGDSIDMKEKGVDCFDESYYNDTSTPHHQPYSYSKTVAEKTAWKLAMDQQNWDLVVMNPSFVMGPPLTGQSASESLTFMHNILSGKFRFGAPDLWFGFVDVRDVAHAHLYALQDEKAEGRYVLSERTMSVPDLCDVVKKLYGDRFKVSVSAVPKWIFALMAPFFGVTRAFVKRNVGYPLCFDHEKSKTLGLTYTPIVDTIKDMVDRMDKEQ